MYFLLNVYRDRKISVGLTRITTRSEVSTKAIKITPEKSGPYLYSLGYNRQTPWDPSSDNHKGGVRMYPQHRTLQAFLYNFPLKINYFQSS